MRARIVVDKVYRNRVKRADLSARGTIMRWTCHIYLNWIYRWLHCASSLNARDEESYERDLKVSEPGKIALFALLCLIWGSTWLAIKVGYGGLGPFSAAAMRFVI